jgi:membrane-bound lytic murein transglycosylase B
LRERVSFLRGRRRGSTLVAAVCLALAAPAADSVRTRAQAPLATASLAVVPASVSSSTRHRFDAAPGVSGVLAADAALVGPVIRASYAPHAGPTGRAGGVAAQPSRISPSDGGGRPQRLALAYSDAVRRVAARYAIDPSLVLAMIELESGGDPAATSPAGAIGLMQLMPSTADALGVNPWNPVENIEGAVRYLDSLRAMFGSVELSLVAYNAGPTFAVRYRDGQAELSAETRSFLTKVRQLLPH